MNVIIVGTGNVAVTLGKLLLKADHTITDIYGRNATTSNEVATLLNAKAIAQFSQMSVNADVCIIAVSDNAIETVAKQININKTLVVHTSGATSKEVLNRFKNYGIMYPLQTLRREINYIPAIPFFVDANTTTSVELLKDLASSTGNEVSVSNDEQRLQLHLAAVICSNFTNHLYALAEAFCINENINFKSLYPLIKETAERLSFFPAAQLQTGPAIRNDTITIQRHLELLQHYPQLQYFYEAFTKSIQQFSSSS